MNQEITVHCSKPITHLHYLLLSLLIIQTIFVVIISRNLVQASKLLNDTNQYNIIQNNTDTILKENILNQFSKSEAQFIQVQKDLIEIKKHVEEQQ